MGYACWGRLQKKTLTRSTCMCFLFYARKARGLYPKLMFDTEFLCIKFRLFLNEVIISFYLLPTQASINGRSSTLSNFYNLMANFQGSFHLLFSATMKIWECCTQVIILMNHPDKNLLNSGNVRCGCGVSVGIQMVHLTLGLRFLQVPGLICPKVG